MRVHIPILAPVGCISVKGVSGDFRDDVARQCGQIGSVRGSSVVEHLKHLTDVAMTKGSFTSSDVLLICRVSETGSPRAENVIGQQFFEGLRGGLRGNGGQLFNESIYAVRCLHGWRNPAGFSRNISMRSVGSSDQPYQKLHCRNVQALGAVARLATLPLLEAFSA